MLGLKRGEVRLVDHEAEWSVLFLEEKEIIERKLGSIALGVEHIGSTAISGIKAKPILDLSVGVASKSQYKECIQPLEDIGYQYIPRDKEDLLFVKGTEDSRTHHLKVTSIDLPFWSESIRFRDYLNAHPDAAGEYESLKLQLAVSHGSDREAYTKEKNSFIQRILENAGAE